MDLSGIGSPLQNFVGRLSLALIVTRFEFKIYNCNMMIFSLYIAAFPMDPRSCQSSVTSGSMIVYYHCREGMNRRALLTVQSIIDPDQSTPLQRGNQYARSIDAANCSRYYVYDDFRSIYRVCNGQDMGQYVFLFYT